MPLESHKQRIAPFSVFIRRLARYTMFAFILIIVSLGIGTLGYYYFAHLDWLESFYMASMILTGMGPTSTMTTQGAKIFSALYALYSGVAFLSISAVFFAPIIHRFLHKLHIDGDGKM